jgi:ankyrin repeat protein
MGITPLWLAAEQGSAEIVEALLQTGADANATRGRSGETALMLAARAGHVEVLQRLLAYSADVNVTDDVRQQTALMWAAAESHALAARLLVEAGAQLEARSSTGLTALMFAIRAGDVATTRVLLDVGADLSVQAPDGTTALSLAIINAHWDVAALLLERGADPNGNDALHGRPLHALAFMRRAENHGLSSILPRRETGALSSIQLAAALLAKGANVNDRIDWPQSNQQPPHMSLGGFGASYVGATPLFLAAKSCDIEMLRFLVANGADARIATIQNITPFLAAAGVGYAPGGSPETAEEALQAVQFLYAIGSDIRASADSPVPQAGGGRGGGTDGAGALHGAVAREAPELVKWLIDHGAPLDHKNKSGQTAFDTVYRFGLSTTRTIRDVIGEILREAMVARGLPVPRPPGSPSANN